jgi:hypothetical protein
MGCQSLFHATSKAAAASILREGFAGGWGDAGFGVYFFDNLPDAVDYARRGGWDGELRSLVVIEACVDRGLVQRIEPDPGWPNPEDYETVRYVEMDDDDKKARLNVPRSVVWPAPPKKRRSSKRRSSRGR